MLILTVIMGVVLFVADRRARRGESDEEG